MGDVFLMKDPEVCDSIKELRAKKEYEENMKNRYIIKRKYYEKMSDETLEALFTKFYDIIIDDSEDPYVLKYTNKKEAAVYFGKKIASKINKRNLDRSINYIHQASESISKFGSGINTDTNFLVEKKKPVKKTKRKTKKNSTKTENKYEFLTGSKRKRGVL